MEMILMWKVSENSVKNPLLVSFSNFDVHFAGRKSCALVSFF